MSKTEFFSSLFKYPIGLAVDASGNIYVADDKNGLVKVMTPGCASANIAGCITTVGSGFS